MLPSTTFLLVQAAIFQQDSAVIFFFVLSGHVLAQSLSRDDRFLPFIWRRCTRLLPTMWISILAATVVANYMQTAAIPGASPWFNDNFLRVDTGWHNVALNLLGQSILINGAMWSIHAELVMMLILPLMTFLLARAPIGRVVVGALALCAFTDGCLMPAMLSKYLSLRPIAYVYCFYLGAIIPRLLTIDFLRPYLQSGPAVVVALLAYLTMYILMRHGLFTLATMFVINAAISTHIICYVVSSPQRAQWLLHRSLVWLGDISFSFYAFGQTILAASGYLLFTHLPAGWWSTHPAYFTIGVSAMALALVTPIAALSFYVVERPTMRLGRLSFHTASTTAYPDDSDAPPRQSK